MGIREMELGSVQVVCSQVPDLNTAIAAPTVDHLSLVRVLGRCDGNFGATGSFRLHQNFVSKLLLDSDFLCVHVPLANRAILRTGYKLIVLLRVPLSIIDACNVALCVCHV